MTFDVGLEVHHFLRC